MSQNQCEEMEYGFSADICRVFVSKYFSNTEKVIAEQIKAHVSLNRYIGYVD